LLDVLIIGAGPAGLTAALYAKRYGLDVTVLEGNLYGGQIANAPEVENYPGIRSISGVDLALQIYDQVAALGVDVKLEGALSFDFSGTVKKVITPKGVHEAKTVIIANGARRRKLDCKGEETLNGRGVSYCATCDGSF
jgi:thioredoxin reductase (NADPH)